MEAIKQIINPETIRNVRLFPRTELIDWVYWEESSPVYKKILWFKYKSRPSIPSGFGHVNQVPDLYSYHDGWECYPTRIKPSNEYSVKEGKIFKNPYLEITYNDKTRDIFYSDEISILENFIFKLKETNKNFIECTL